MQICNEGSRHKYEPRKQSLFREIFLPNYYFLASLFFFSVVNSFRLFLLSPIKKITDRNVK